MVWIALILVISLSQQINQFGIDWYGSGATGHLSFQRYLLYFSPYIRIGEFILGALTCHLHQQVAEWKPSASERRLGELLIACAIVAVVAIWFVSYSVMFRWWPLLYLRQNFSVAIPVAVLIFGVARYRTGIARLFSARPMIVLGEASYSIYLVHFGMFLSLRTIGAGFLPPDLLESLRWGRLLFVLALIFALAILLFNLIERPSRRWLRGLWTKAALEKAEGRYAVGAIAVAPLVTGLALVSVWWSL